MKIIIDCDEEYPVYYFRELTDENKSKSPYCLDLTGTDVPDEKILKWNKILEEYNQMQDELSALNHDANEQAFAAYNEWQKKNGKQ